jgi:photosystem II stability/assembly factor-like uncharacterized protein
MFDGTQVLYRWNTFAVSGVNTMRSPLVAKASMREQEDQAAISTDNNNTRKHRSSNKAGLWQRRFSMIAAIVVVALLVSALFLVLSRARQSSSDNAGSAQKAAGGSGILRSLHMIDTMTGWALSEHAVLKTTDGGLHWKNVTPSGTTVTSNSIAEFCTASMVWLAVPQAQATNTQIVHTTDGGATWQQTTIQAAFPRWFSFVDSQHGWLLASWRQAGGGGAAESVSVFSTTDGGKSWTKMADALFADATPPGHLPYGGQKSGIRFLDASTGWITGSVVVPSIPWLYTTHDGGSSWYRQSLPMPPGVSSAQIGIVTPTFFSTTDGILPIIFSDITTEKRIAADIYVTHDGGKTWQHTSLLPVGLSIFDFVDMLHGWASDGSLLYMTSDGGNRWIKLSPNESFQHVSLLDFVTSTLGWAISSPPSMPSSLLKTIDGGRTWTVVSPVIGRDPSLRSG